MGYINNIEQKGKESYAVILCKATTKEKIIKGKKIKRM
jgi:hypothetical protein